MGHISDMSWIENHHHKRYGLSKFRKKAFIKHYSMTISSLRGACETYICVGKLTLFWHVGYTYEICFV